MTIIRSRRRHSAVKKIMKIELEIENNNEPTSILEFVNSVIDDIGVIDERHDDHDRVTLGWWEAMEAIKGLIEDGVPSKSESEEVK